MGCVEKLKRHFKAAYIMSEIPEPAALEGHFQVNLKILEVLIPTCTAAVKKANTVTARGLQCK